MSEELIKWQGAPPGELCFIISQDSVIKNKKQKLLVLDLFCIKFAVQKTVQKAHKD